MKTPEREMQKIRGNEISMIFQEPMTSLNPIIKCGKQIAESLRLHRGKMCIRDRINELVEDMSVFDVFLYANDYHNLKAAIKERCV